MSPIKPKRTKREISSKFLVEFLLQIGFDAIVTVRQDFDAEKYILVGVSKTDPNDFQYLDVSALSTIYLIEKVPESTTQLNLDSTTLNDSIQMLSNELEQTDLIQNTTIYMKSISDETTNITASTSSYETRSTQSTIPYSINVLYNFI